MLPAGAARSRWDRSAERALGAMPAIEAPRSRARSASPRRTASMTHRHGRLESDEADGGGRDAQTEQHVHGRDLVPARQRLGRALDSRPSSIRRYVRAMDRARSLLSSSDASRVRAEGSSSCVVAPGQARPTTASVTTSDDHGAGAVRCGRTRAGETTAGSRDQDGPTHHLAARPGPDTSPHGSPRGGPPPGEGATTAHRRRRVGAGAAGHVTPSPDRRALARRSLRSTARHPSDQLMRTTLPSQLQAASPGPRMVSARKPQGRPGSDRLATFVRWIARGGPQRAVDR